MSTPNGQEIDLTGYRPHPEYPWLMVSKAGDLINAKGKPFRIAQQLTWRGYKSTSIWSCGMAKRLAVHRAVLQTFVGPGGDLQASHLNGNKTDNRLENLAWETPLQNVARTRDHGTATIGMRHGHAKLTDADVIEIRRLRSEGVRAAVLAESYKIHESNVRYIVSGKTWTHIK